MLIPHAVEIGGAGAEGRVRGGDAPRPQELLQRRRPRLRLRPPGRPGGGGGGGGGGAAGEGGEEGGAGGHRGGGDGALGDGGGDDVAWRRGPN